MTLPARTPINVALMVAAIVGASIVLMVGYGPSSYPARSYWNDQYSWTGLSATTLRQIGFVLLAGSCVWALIASMPRPAPSSPRPDRWRRMLVLALVMTLGVVMGGALTWYVAHIEISYTKDAWFERGRAAERARQASKDAAFDAQYGDNRR